MNDPCSQTSRTIIWFILAASLLLVGVRIATVKSPTGEVPFLSANDRSRWATVASLVDYRTYAIDQLQNRRDPVTKRKTWQTIDRVQHRDTDGQIHDYSSKPPLLATILAGYYAAIKSLTGWSIQQSPFLVGRLILLLFNLPLLALTQWCVIDVVRRYAQQRWTTYFLTTTIAFGTLLTPFAITLNNHLPAAASVAVTVWLLQRQSQQRTSGWQMLFAGIAVAMTVANELPALSFAAFFSLGFLWLGNRSQRLMFGVGIAAVVVVFFGTNYAAHQSWRPPYAHRSVGPMLAQWEPISQPPLDQVPDSLQTRLAELLQVPANDLRFTASRTPSRLRVDTDTQTVALDFTATHLQISRWDDWYDYPGTYWSDEKRAGIDQGEPSRLRYTWHVLGGHHGLFSLTPVWLLCLAGPWLFLKRSPGWFKQLCYHFLPLPPSNSQPAKTFPFLPFVVVGTTAITIVCLLFYLARPLIDRNYGGVSAGFRWLIWLIPLWVFMATATVDSLSQQRFTRWLCIVLLCGSMFTVFASMQSPWNHPWIYRLMYDIPVLDLHWIGLGKSG